MIEQNLKAEPLKRQRGIGKLKMGEDCAGPYLYFEYRPHDKFYLSISEISDRDPSEIIEVFEDMASKAAAFEEMAKEISEAFNKKVR